LDKQATLPLSRPPAALAEFAAMPREGLPPVNIGHRGHADTLENTLPSFLEAVGMGAAMVELDVRLSKDGVPMVIHDRTIHRVSGGRRGVVEQLTAARLATFELRSGYRIPTLEQVLGALAPRIPVNVELKFDRPEYRPLATAVCEVVAKLGVVPRVLVSSFHHQSLLIAEKLLPELSVAPLFGCLTGLPHDDDLQPVFARAPRRDCPGVYPFCGPAAVVWNKMIDAPLVERFNRAEATLLTYTVDEPQEMKRLIALGIDGIITNRPALLEGVLSELFGPKRAP
jgi:glycerophosphoryl diester phosphodiesterase